MNQTMDNTSGSPALRNLAIVAAVVIVAIVVAGEFNLSFTWSLIATVLPVLVIISFERMRATYKEYKFWYDCTPITMDIRTDVRYHMIVGSTGFGFTLLGAGFFYARGNPWWIAGFTVASLICLMLGPVEDEPQGE